MRDNRPAQQQVADLTPEQRKKILTVGILSDVVSILLVAAVVVLLWLPQLRAVKASQADADEIYQQISTENDKRLEIQKEAASSGEFLLVDLIPYDEWDEAMAEADGEAEKLLIISIVIGVLLLIICFVQFIVVKKTVPYYSDSKFFYILFHKKQLHT